VVESLDNRNASVDAKQRFVGVEGEVGEADGFQILGDWSLGTSADWEELSIYVPSKKGRR
jgi:hypothetical protein